MKLNRTYLFTGFSSVALLTVLIIQVNWILTTAKIKEDLFNEKANMVLSRTAEALRSDRETCMKIGACADTETTPGLSLKLGQDEVRKIDSLFRHYMNLYHFQIGFSFVVTKPGVLNNLNGSGSEGYTYNKSLADPGSNASVELKLLFPSKKQFIISELGTLFLASVILILVVLFLFWRTLYSLVREKRISEHTTDYLNNMTHEFKTPLTNIGLAGRMILKESSATGGGKIPHYAGIILEENEKLRLQVDQVLSMTALERGEIPLQKSDLDLHEVIRDALKSISLQIEHKDGTVDLKLEAERSGITGDRTHLMNAMCNLIDNAVKYSRENPEISVHTFTCGSHLLVSVSDRGIGIDRNYQKQVFKKFFRVPTGDVHDVKGFGLGLAYVKKIVEMHGGSIGLQSAKEKGTTFIISLPYAGN